MAVNWARKKIDEKDSKERFFSKCQGEVKLVQT
jgi:hypothetical protein